MAHEALLRATLQRLESKLHLTDDEAGIQPTGQPDAFVGQRYYAIHPAGWHPENPEDELIDGSYAVTITITLRAGATIADRRGPELVVLATRGLLPLARAAGLACHMSYTLMDSANALIPASENGFLEPLRLLSIGPVMEKQAAWLYSDTRSKSRAADGTVALAVEVRLGKARRFEALADATLD